MSGQGFVALAPICSNQLLIANGCPWELWDQRVYLPMQESAAKKGIYPPKKKNNMSPENQWLEDVLSY